MNKQIIKKNWNEFVSDIKKQSTTECITYQNMQNAEFHSHS